MAIYKCKMCGGTLEVQEGASSCTCDFCGTQQTIPTSKDEGLQNLFNRANALRMKSEFDKASEIYEKIIQNNAEESEAYWGLILCKYGIEYVEDPVTYKRIPTCHRASYDAVNADEDYKNAVKYADVIQRGIYEAEAAAIEEIQKGILALAQKEDPYDVFICYKETDENGKRTQDSVIANDIYHQLKQEGFKVFYAAITLEDKLGSAYEPYIFSALNTSKVMLSLGTKPEYFNAVWVKNEWSRFLKIMKKDRSKLLIPCYRDMDAYELPEEFAHLQAQDMGKIGFINDLIRGIKKVIVKDTPKAQVKETVVVQQSAGGTNVSAQIKRGNMALEDRDWVKADGFFEEALNQDPENGEAYLGKLLAREKMPNLTSWTVREKNLNEKALNNEVKMACEADKEHIEKMVEECKVPGYLDEQSIRGLYDFARGYDSYVADREKQKEQQESKIKYDRLLTRVNQYAKGETKKAIDSSLKSISDELQKRVDQAKQDDQKNISRIQNEYAEHVKTVDEKVRNLSQEAQNKREADYQKAVSTLERAKEIREYRTAISAFKSINPYKDSYQRIEHANVKIKEIKEIEEAKAKEIQRQAILEKKKKRNKTILFSSIVAVAAAVAIVFFTVIKPGNEYNAAMSLMKEGRYTEAIEAFTALGGYRDSAEQITNCENGIKDQKYEAAEKLMNEKKFSEAIEAFTALGGYKDSAEQITNCENGIKDQKYEAAEKLMNEKKYNEAIEAFTALGGYKDSAEQIMNCRNLKLKESKIGSYVYFGSYEQDNNTSNGTEEIEWLVLAKEGNKALLISRYALDTVRYNTQYINLTWAKSSLRYWLNSTFINQAFTSEQQKRILRTSVSADKNPDYSTNPGNATMDQVFLLSIPEVNKYFSSDEARKCVPTNYAKAQGAYVSDSGQGNCWWWLRSPGNRSNDAAYVDIDGSVFTDGLNVDNSRVCVRPALWIDLNA